MRQVKAKATPFERANGNNRRGKSAPRPSEPRTVRRGSSPEASRHGLARRLFFRWPILTLTLVLMVIGSAVGLFAGGHVAKAIGSAQAAIVAPFTNAGFAVREIAITGEERTTEQAASAALALTKGSSIFGVRPDAARARLLMLPWVADAEVRRHFPDKVTVRVIEKRPFALWKTGNDLSVVERSGAVITKLQDNPFPHLPLLSGIGAQRAWLVRSPGHR
jgi:cell division protein FtsQ